MFTGLVEDVGTVVATELAGDAVVLTVRPERIPLAELAIGDSLCHDGTCLTITGHAGAAYTVLAGAETLARTTLGTLAAGKRVNLERALRVGDRLGGHWVTGHIDGTGTIARLHDTGSNLVIDIAAPPDLLRYIVAKGSIALAGTSLTVNTVDLGTFSVALIPITREATNLGDLVAGDRVNLEVDILAKHVEKLLAGGHR